MAEQLRLTKLPVLWSYRPAVYPAWNARHQRVVRFWSAKAGPDERSSTGWHSAGWTASRSSNRRGLSWPTNSRWSATSAAGGCIRCSTTIGTWAGGASTMGFGVQPEDYLWRAAEAVDEIEAALARA